MIISGTALAGDSKDSKPDWPALKFAFRKYVEYPSKENASHVITLLPEKHVRYTGTKEEKETLDYIYSWDQLGMLERQVISRNREAVRLAFKLHSIADGAFSEDLDIMLGILVRIDSKLFLEELKLAKPDDQSLSSSISNYGSVYVDRLKARCYETKSRISALEGVKETSLVELRNKCIGELKKSEKQFCK